jgi:multiple sugar transport system permease protein
MGTGALDQLKVRPPAAKRVGVRGVEKGMRPWTPWLFLAPYLLLFGMFVAIPVIYGLWISLHNWDQFLDEKPWARCCSTSASPGAASSAPCTSRPTCSAWWS